MTTPPPARPGPFTVRSPEDLLAVVPLVLGFHPARSVVMLTFGAARTFHARCDLPSVSAAAEVAAAEEELATTLLRPVVRHRVASVAFVVYTDDEAVAERVGRALRRRFEGAGVRVLVTLRADGRRWWTCPAGSAGVPRHGVPYDVSNHPAVAQAVLAGRVTRDSRQQLAATVAADPAWAEAVAAALASRESEPAGADPVRCRAARLRVVGVVRRHVAAGTAPAAGEAAEILDALGDRSTRELVLRSVRRDVARGHVGLWSSLVRGAPPRALAVPAMLLAWSAWQAGDGALAWCALDRAAEATAPDPMVPLIEQILTDAVPPSVADDLWRRCDALDPGVHPVTPDASDVDRPPGVPPAA